MYFLLRTYIELLSNADEQPEPIPDLPVHTSAVAPTCPYSPAVGRSHHVVMDRRLLLYTIGVGIYVGLQVHSERHTSLCPFYSRIA